VQVFLELSAAAGYRVGEARVNPNPTWPAEWEKAITDGLKQYSYPDPIQFVPDPPVHYDDLFEQNPEPTTEYLQATYELLQGWMLSPVSHFADLDQ
jgi:hypothetical protein